MAVSLIWEEVFKNSVRSQGRSSAFGKISQNKDGLVWVRPSTLWPCLSRDDTKGEAKIKSKETKECCFSFLGLAHDCKGSISRGRMRKSIGSNKVRVSKYKKMTQIQQNHIQIRENTEIQIHWKYKHMSKDEDRKWEGATDLQTKNVWGDLSWPALEVVTENCTGLVSKHHH